MKNLKQIIESTVRAEIKKHSKIITLKEAESDELLTDPNMRMLINALDRCIPIAKKIGRHEYPKKRGLDPGDVYDDIQTGNVEKLLKAIYAAYMTGDPNNHEYTDTIFKR